MCERLFYRHRNPTDRLLGLVPVMTVVLVHAVFKAYRAPKLVNFLIFVSNSICVFLTHHRASDMRCSPWDPELRVGTFDGVTAAMGENRLLCRPDLYSLFERGFRFVFFKCFSLSFAEPALELNYHRWLAIGISAVTLLFTMVGIALWAPPVGHVEAIDHWKVCKNPRIKHSQLTFSRVRWHLRFCIFSKGSALFLPQYQSPYRAVERTVSVNP
ncbi:hypothetical protein BJ742DRAFT_835857 [Cladochytrium replicatum]|nr:hypothetical protein BJ742DRAFT_835857 [Cladochytrium replicatum]